MSEQSIQIKDEKKVELERKMEQFKEKAKVMMGQDDEKLVATKESLRRKFSDVSFVTRQYTAESFQSGVIASYGRLYGGKTLSKSDQAKRMQKAAQKAVLQRDLMRETHDYLEERDKVLMPKMEKAVLSAGATNISRHMSLMQENNPYAELIRDWAALEDLEERKAISIINDFSKMENTKNAVKYMHQELMSADLSQFEYKNDKEFVTNLKQKYAKLRAYAHIAETEKMELGGNGGKYEVDKLELRARLKLVLEIKEDYENRMILMQSPYYVMLAGKDVLNVSDKKFALWKKNLLKYNMNPGLLAYLETIEKQRKQKTFRKGDVLADRLKKETEQLRKEDYKKGSSEYKKVMKEVEEFAKKKKSKDYRGTMPDPALKKKNPKQYQAEADKYRKTLKEYFEEKGHEIASKTEKATRQNCGEIVPKMGGDLLEGFGIEDFPKSAALNEKYLTDKEFRDRVGGDPDYARKFEKEQEHEIDLLNQMNDAAEVNLLATAYEDDYEEHAYISKNPLYSKEEIANIELFRSYCVDALLPIGETYETKKRQYVLNTYEMFKSRARAKVALTRDPAHPETKDYKAWVKLDQMMKEANCELDKDIIDKAYKDAESNHKETDEAWKKEHADVLETHSLTVGGVEFPFPQLTAKIGYFNGSDGRYFLDANKKPVSLKDLLLGKKPLQAKEGVTPEMLKEAYNDLLPELLKHQAYTKFQITERLWLDGIANMEIVHAEMVNFEEQLCPKLAKFLSLVDLK